MTSTDASVAMLEKEGSPSLKCGTYFSSPRSRSAVDGIEKVLVIALLTPMAILASAQLAAAQNRTGIIRILYIGEPFAICQPAQIMASEPLIDLTKIEASLWIGTTTAVMRSLRMYMPRSYADLTDKYDGIVISDANVYIFEHKHIVWMADSVEKDGLGLFMPGGYEGLGGFRGGNPSWGPTKVGDILPVIVYEQGFYLEQPSAVDIPSLKMDNPFIMSMPWDTLVSPYNIFGQGGGMNQMTQKDGSVLMGNLKRLRDGFIMPWLVYWDIDKGRSLAMSADWSGAGTGLFGYWDYYGDFVTGLMLYIAQRDIPQDYQLLHRTRAKYVEYAEKKNLVLSLLDFIDKFGANPRPVESKIAEADEIREAASRDYISYEFDLALAGMTQALEVLGESTDLAFKLKDSAFFWVYVTEWSAVSGTFILAGSIVYSLMIRRKMYREVVTTTLRQDA